MKLSKHVDWLQIRALLRKDYLVRIRQPWMTLIQYMWPCVIFLSLYVLRDRFQSVQIPECQFPTRQLQNNGILPFFQSYICTIENACSDPKRFEETTDFEVAPVTPLLNIVQIFLDTPELYDAVIKLPLDRNFIGTVTSIVTHGRFKEIESNADKLVRMVPEIQQMVGSNFDIEKLFADDRVFSNSGKILCGKPFPRSDNIRFIDNILYTQDFNGADPDELAVMPTAYCKQLYRDVTNTNNGKITWKQLKPILQGKILYGPPSDRNDEIIKFANQTFVDMGRLQSFFKALNTTVGLLHTNDSFRESFEALIELAKSPIVQMIAGGNVNIDLIESMLNGILNDETVAKTLGTIASIFDCFSTDRFVEVKTEGALEDEAFKLNQKKLFFAGIFFENSTRTNDILYKIRMRIDDTPVTVENRNRFWFPGPDASFELDMRYHRGFIQIQHAVDMGIIKTLKQKMSKVEKEAVRGPSSGQKELTLGDDLDDGEENRTTTVTPTTAELDALYSNLGMKINISKSDVERFNNKSTIDDYLNFDEDDDDDDDEDDIDGELSLDGDDELTTTMTPSRRKRAPQFSFLDLFLGGGRPKSEEISYNVAKEKFYTKQFPYPEYTRDDFKKGLYLAQSIQMSFFIALIVQVSSSVRHKIWMKESGNIMLMRSMGLKANSDSISWAVTTLVELCIIFVLVLAILYGGGILIHSSKMFLFTYLLVFGICLIAFCYMCSMFFASASIGSVSTVILFLATFLPYIIIISLGAVLSFGSKVVASLSFSTAFCYAWRHLMRMELQHRTPDFTSAFGGSIEDNDLMFGIVMMLLDAIIYFLVGLIYEKLTNEDTTFYQVNRIKLDKSIGAELRNVDVIYENNKKALDDVTIAFKRDEVTCLLGRNGAGKSTIIKLLTGQIRPVVGDVHLPLDYDLISGLRNNAEKIGLCSQQNVLIPKLTAKEHLQLYARIKLTKGFDTEIQRTLDNLKMGKYKHYRASELSGGFKRRLCIAIAFLGSPNLVILDEPCSSVDTKARKYIWELIQTLRKERAVILATHHLDEAESLSDKVVILEDGKAILEQSQEELKNRFTNTLYVDITLKGLSETDRTNVISELDKCLSQQTSVKYDVSKLARNKLLYKLTYAEVDPSEIDLQPLFDQLNRFQEKTLILHYDIKNENLLNIFNTLNNREKLTTELSEPEIVTDNGFHGTKPTKNKQSTFQIITSLLSKRFLHFRRNYRLLICLLVLPTLFQIVAMFFMTIRPPGEHDKALEFSTDLYKGSTEFYTKPGSGSVFQTEIDSNLLSRCLDRECFLFNSSEDAFRWVLETSRDFAEQRYGGLTARKEKHFIWYNNKGYHSMPVWLNMLDSAILKAELENTNYSIRTINHPLRIEEDELTISSILQKVADAGISLIILLAFSLVLAGGSVYIVNERVRGEKMQQKLAGVKFKHYWGVSLLWDAMVFLIALALAVIVFQIFAIPAYVDKDQLSGICLLLVFYGFASIPAVHLFEKWFNDASFANMSLFCLNVIIALCTLTIIILFDILGETDTSEHFRNFLNRAFLVFPQHALADGLIELSKNYIQAEIFKRYYINTYKSPLTILEPHFIALVVMGIVFIVLNHFAEKKVLEKLFLLAESPDTPVYELDTVHSDGVLMNGNGKKKSLTAGQILSVDHLTKRYRHGEPVVNDVSFKIHYGECFGLLGTNGAGKSTIFAILAGEQLQSGGSFCFFSPNGLAYCPQNNFLDPLLTVEEVIRFYGKLRNIENIDKLVEETIREYHLEPYKHILVKNLSGGNRRKLCVAVACFGNTDIILMDEPTSDMDPVTRAIVYRTIERLNSQNRSILLTSHSIAEINHICQRIGILKDGTLLTIDTPENLSERYGNNYLVTIYLEENREVDLIRTIKREFNVSQEFVHNKNSLQFVCKIRPEREHVGIEKLHKNSQVTINLNNNTIDSSLALVSSISALVVKLHKFAQNNRLRYTVARCLLDQVFENVLQNHEEEHSNQGFAEN
ncbi:glucosylceramide transporter ABCA12 [Toxorhynchites rutilus septentrionalis]|uniref:glucosylceramide transporter ABCA12 n=1 Tax=Toxorhynchites rutilus septentrionalis TaxID=329112 RepID=UPI00247AA3DD|nr:glucosylceramide transporter ABCA12 [Toxorhynchites rutilus septentrionalis]XP_055631847.1 glucosylceramide transporter ABCA12 [Toxorhynchites rutilus septentrionalis]XP_055631848.1 glucosylceramide transporter ABCA12 [Toxorhynchites rutilus septentrionalis]XP_055631849.1 glucosylceramide transporter ABCA12 [Toxorhynchites rutilus septentrionalis]XP_055631851.1 glucosylceramide transporter ABCA12 [Toxorhynchites rutilus septentrionalis]